MAMSILNNTVSMLSLGELNKNISAFGKQQKKLASGMRINSAGDDASGYAISEKMRAHIRTLDQDRLNVRTGSSLLRVADGGINNIVDELRNLKELAINAANDHNTDADRAIIQKEFDQKKANIDDIATTTNYNGKMLLDGRYYRNARSSQVSSGRFEGVAVNSTTGLFANTSGLASLTVPINGKTPGSGATWINGNQVLEGTPDTNFNLDFSGATRNGATLNLPDDMDGQGFYVVCAGNDSGAGLTGFNRYPGCASSHAFIFDASMSVGSYRINQGPEQGDGMHTTAMTVGIAGVTNPADLAKALYEGAAAASGYSYTSGPYGNVNVTASGNAVTIRSYSDTITFHRNPDNDTYSMSRTYGMWLYEGFPQISTDGELDYNPLVIHHGTKSAQALNIYINDMHVKSLKSPIPDVSDVDRLFNLMPGSSYGDYPNALQAADDHEPFTKIEIMDDIMEDLAANDSEFARSSTYKAYTEYKSIINTASRMSLDDIDVTTQKNANIAIRVMDGAIKYALNEATTVGAYISRLEYTEDNIVTANENSVAAESVIRDADMAKEMAGFTKANILSQASQSMLAQANQNSGQVMSLLQG